MTSKRLGRRVVGVEGRLALLGALGVLLPASAYAAESNDGAAVNEAAPAPPEHPTHHGSVFVDPLGLLLFGPTAGVELGAGRFSGTLYGRWLNEGVLGHSLFLNEGDSFAFSYGAGLRGRYYFRDDFGGAHLGVGLELVHTRVDNSGAQVSTKSTYVVPLLEGGYRIPFSGAYVGGAAAFGYAFKASSGVENLPGGHSADSFVANNESTVYGSAALELGVYF